jgi:ABC-type transport system involved in Fe-S cluster assembly fused permease/ATPase subunit
VIADRLRTIAGADRISVVRRGHILERGAYRELMLRRGLFSGLGRRQLA